MVYQSLFADPGRGAYMYFTFVVRRQVLLGMADSRSYSRSVGGVRHLLTRAALLAVLCAGAGSRVAQCYDRLAPVQHNAVADAHRAFDDFPVLADRHSSAESFNLSD